MSEASAEIPAPAPAHRRRARYAGTHPRQFHEKYKELAPEQHPDTVARVLAAGKTPAGSHRPVMLAEVLAALNPQPGEFAVDCTLGHAGHARELLRCVQPGGHLLALDTDPLELPRAAEELARAGFAPESFTLRHSNFAGLSQLLVPLAPDGADVILADLGCSSMQLDNPERGFSYKRDGPLDMRLNPRKGQSAAAWLARATERDLARALAENADEPRAAALAAALAGKDFPTTRALANAVRATAPGLGREETDAMLRRVFQAVRIAVNEEFTALETWLRRLPACLKPGGRAAVLTFHSGEDRRVKHAFRAGHAAGDYAEIAEEIIRPTPEETHANPRAKPAKLRWARRAAS